MDSEKDKKVKKIARFLELGGTMLAEQCNVCGAPKFRYRGTVICPICDVRDEEEEKLPSRSAEVKVPEKVPEPRPSPEKSRPWYQAKEEASEKQLKSLFGPEATVEGIAGRTVENAIETTIPSAGGKENVKRNISVQLPEFEKDRALLEGLLFKKLIGIATSLQSENDPRRIVEALDLIEKGLGLIKTLRQE